MLAKGLTMLSKDTFRPAHKTLQACRKEREREGDKTEKTKHDHDLQAVLILVPGHTGGRRRD